MTRLLFILFTLGCVQFGRVHPQSSSGAGIRAALRRSFRITFNVRSFTYASPQRFRTRRCDLREQHPMDNITTSLENIAMGFVAVVVT